jgi:hypothetical protein
MYLMRCGKAIDDIQFKFGVFYCRSKFAVHVTASLTVPVKQKLLIIFYTALKRTICKSKGKMVSKQVENQIFSLNFRHAK